MKLFRAILPVITGICTALAVRAAEPEPQAVLRILNWSDYIDLDDPAPDHAPVADRSPTLRRFQKETGCRIEYFEYDEAVDMNARVMNMPGFFDVVMVSQDDARQMARAGLTRVLPDGPRLTAACAPYGLENGARHFLPYLVGVLGLAVRTDGDRTPVKCWADVFVPPAGTAPRVGLTACPFEQTYAALKWAGRPLSTTNREDLAAASRMLGKLRDSGRLAVMSSDMEVLGRALVEGRLDAAMMYSTDAQALIEENPQVPLAFVIPDEGAEQYVDGWMILRSSRNPALAARFLEFMARPENHAAIAGWLGARPTTDAAWKICCEQDPDFARRVTVAPPPGGAGKLEVPTVVAQDIVPFWTGVMHRAPVRAEAAP